MSSWVPMSLFQIWNIYLKTVTVLLVSFLTHGHADAIKHFLTSVRSESSCFWFRVDHRTKVFVMKMIVLKIRMISMLLMVSQKWLGSAVSFSRHNSTYSRKFGCCLENIWRQYRLYRHLNSTKQLGESYAGFGRSAEIGREGVLAF